MQLPSIAFGDVIKQEIDSLATLLESYSKKKIPGLKEKIDFTVSGISLKEFLRALGESANLNMHIDNEIRGQVNNTFNGEKAYNILLFLCQEYELNLEIMGSIISIDQKKPDEKPKGPIQRFQVEFRQYDNQIRIQASNDTLKNLIREIIDQSGKNIIPAPSIREKLVSIYLAMLPFEAALEKLAFANGLILEKDRDGTFRILENLLEQEAKSNTRNLAGRNFGSPRVSRPKLFLNVRKENSEDQLIDAELVEASIQDVLNELVNHSDYNYIFFGSPPGLITVKVNDLPHDCFLDYLLQGTNFTYAEKEDVYLIGERKKEGLRSSELVQFKYRSVEDLLAMIPKDLGKEVEIKVFEELNGLLVSGSKPRINEIKEFIKPLDRLVPLILIEVVAIDVKKGRDVETGIKAGISDSVKTGGSLLPGLNFTFSSSSINNLSEAINTKGLINLGKVNPNFYATLQAMEKNNHIKIRSTPKLATLNGHEANLTIGQTEYYLEQTQNIQSGNNPITTVTPQFREINADLNIAIDPLVSADNHVTLKILAEFSSFTEPFVINGPPGKSTRRFESIIRVRNEEMIVLGGLEETRKTRQTEGIPFLSRLPVLKWIFSSVNQGKGETRILVFIKPTIVY